jgi:hypothetical protein
VRVHDVATTVDRSAQVIPGRHAVGETPPVLPDDVVETLQSLGDLMA